MTDDNVKKYPLHNLGAPIKKQSDSDQDSGENESGNERPKNVMEIQNDSTESAPEALERTTRANKSLMQ